MVTVDVGGLGTVDMFELARGVLRGFTLRGRRVDSCESVKVGGGCGCGGRNKGVYLRRKQEFAPAAGEEGDCDLCEGER